MVLTLGSETPPDDCPLCARSGWRIPTETPPEKTIGWLRIKADFWVGERRNLEVRSISPYPYNCVGMIFAARRAWIEIDHIERLLREDGYRGITKSQVVAGDIVLYRNEQGDLTHVALVSFVDHGLGSNIKVISKWGLEAEFIHFEDDVPVMLGRPVEYYTERQL